MSFNDVIDGFIRGDPLAPPIVWAMWGTPDQSTFPDDASEDTPYIWDVVQGAWVTFANMSEPR
jgi:hypothetical protein|tara:strand:+ start:1803 stop:1991 length:189 start_codon:yes stop_codon:yes gene_type:complete